jgi:transcriptional regulator with XRE-family HTH domain
MTPTAAARKAKTLTEDEVRELIRNGQGKQSMRDYAESLGISVSYLSDIYSQKRNPGEKILDKFGITKTSRVIVEYTTRK